MSLNVDQAAWLVVGFHIAKNDRLFVPAPDACEHNGAKFDGWACTSCGNVQCIVGGAVPTECSCHDTQSETEYLEAVGLAIAQSDGRLFNSIDADSLIAYAQKLFDRWQLDALPADPG